MLKSLALAVALLFSGSLMAAPPSASHGDGAAVHATAKKKTGKKSTAAKKTAKKKSAKKPVAHAGAKLKTRKSAPKLH